MVSLTVLPVNLFSVPFLGSLAFVCCLFYLIWGRDFGQKGGFPLSSCTPPRHSGMRRQREPLTFYPSGYRGLPLPPLPTPLPPPFLPFPVPVLQPSCGFLAPRGGGVITHSDCCSTIPGPASQVDFSVIIKKEKLQQPTLASWVSLHSSPLSVIRGGCVLVSSKCVASV